MYKDVSTAYAFGRRAQTELAQFHKMSLSTGMSPCWGLQAGDSLFKQTDYNTASNSLPASRCRATQHTDHLKT